MIAKLKRMFTPNIAKRILSTGAFYVIKVAVMPILYVIAVAFSVIPPVIIIYSIAAVLLNLPVTIGIGSMSLNSTLQFFLSLSLGLAMLLIAVACFALIKKYWLPAYYTRKNKNSTIVSSELLMQKSKWNFSVISEIKEQIPTIIKTVSIAIPTLFLLLLMCLVILVTIDSLRIDSYFLDVLFHKAIASGYTKFWVVPGLGSFSKIVLWGSVITILYAVITTVLFYRNKKKDVSQVFKIFSMLVNTSYLVFALFIFTNAIFASYVNRIVDSHNTDQSYVQRIELIKEQIEDKSLSVTLALNKIMADITENPSYFTEMSYEQRLIICREINSLIDQKEGPTNREEHYFRNHLNYAPPNLDAMLKEIKSQKVIKWALMESGQSVYHMFGKNGEYNLKFVSDDGLYEGVYDKDGVLLTAENDAVNMGTYNYASPLSDSKKHTVYDVLPYNVWGNTLFSMSKSDDSALDNLDKFQANADAVERYNQVRLLIESQ